jgi:hypothetical protein
VEDRQSGRIVPLAEIDQGLAERLTSRLVDRFLGGAGLSATYRAECVAQTRIYVVVTTNDLPRQLNFTLPLGSGNPGGFAWDGSEDQAKDITDNAADRGVEDVLWDRANVGPTGWEPEFDDD